MNCSECPDPASYIASRILDDGRVLCVVPLFGGRARLCIGPDWLGIDTFY